MDFPSALEHDASDFYGPLDFIVGSTIEILQKRMVIYDCDDFTYDFYKHQFEVQMNRDMSIYALLSKPKPESTLVKPPPHTITSVGTPEDSLQNCLHLIAHVNLMMIIAEYYDFIAQISANHNTLY